MSTDTPLKRRNFPNNAGRPVHGGFQAAKKYRELPLDLRRAEDKALHMWRKGIISDLGGLERMDGFQCSLLDRCTELMIILSCMAAHVTKHGVMDHQGNLAPCLRTSYISYLNSFSRILASIYERSDKRPPPPPDLNEYLERVHGQGAQ